MPSFLRKVIGISKDKAVSVLGMGMKRSIRLGGIRHGGVHYNNDIPADNVPVNVGQVSNIVGGALHNIKFDVSRKRRNISLKY